MIRKFVNRLDWTKFSSEAEVEVLTPEVIEAFKHKWDWHELSGNPNVPFTDELLEKYADLWDWNEIICIWRNSIYEDKGIDFYDKFQEYIPASKLQNSSLCNEMVEQQEKILINIVVC